MNPSLPAIVTHLWQSTLFAAVVWMVVLALRANHARVRYWLWTAASLKFLVPFSWLVGLGVQVQWRTPPALAQPAATFVIEEVLSPPVLAAARASAIPGTSASPVLSWVLAAVWLTGTLAVLAWWWRQWRPVGAALRTAVPVDLGSSFDARDLVVLSSPSALEPGVVGIRRPVLLLPDGLAERLTPAQMNALLAHERCHIRCRDNLMAASHMLVEAAFWFHPLVWWIERRMIDERERACDEAVLAAGSEPQDYAEGILEVCRSSMESPLACAAGVSGSDLRRRLQSIMAEHVGRPMTAGRRVALALGMVAVVGMPVLAGLLHASPAQVPERGTGAALPQFDVASVRLNPKCADGVIPATPANVPGRLVMRCMPLRSAILTAYVNFSGGVFRGFRSVPIQGAPSWIDSDLYDIEAVAPDAAPQSLMRGPMLQALLEDRFKLQARVETRDVPVYALVPLSGGHRLTPFEQGSCTPPDPVSPVPRAAGDPPYCRTVIGGRPPEYAMAAVEVHAVSVEDFALRLGNVVDRPVVDRTGLEGLWDFVLEFTPDSRTPRLFRKAGGDALPSGKPSIFQAIQDQLGLRLEPSRGRAPYLIIERLERPSEN